ncbi:MAG: hypothetical protein V2A75_02800 [Pseudomonadota bacterium]
MKPKILTLSLMITLALVVVTALGALWQHSAAKELQQEHAMLTQQAKTIDILKTRWGAQESHNEFEYLKNHPNLIKQEKRGGNVYFEYDNLSSLEFNRISNKILNSMLVIKKLTLRRNSASKGIILVEIES